MDYALSDEDITGLLDGKATVMRYGDLQHFDSVDALLKPHGRVFILYESKPGYGHWTVLHRLGPRDVELFDSYGLPIDDELKFIPQKYRKHSAQARAHLSQLLGHSPYRVHYNNHHLQAVKKGINTCGRWCVARCVNNDMDIDTFYEKIMERCRTEGMKPDEVVCDLVSI